MLLFLMSLVPTVQMGFSVPTGQAGSISKMGVWLEAGVRHRSLVGSLLGEQFTSRGEGNYHTSILGLFMGAGFDMGKFSALSFAAGPVVISRSYGNDSETGFAPGLKSDLNFFYPNTGVRVGLNVFARFYPGSSSLLSSYGAGLSLSGSP